MSISSFADRQFLIHIDSHQRLSGTHQDGLYKINIENGTIQDYDRVVLLSATVPKSYYAIEEGFNSFVLDENGATATITIPPGTYSANQFKDILPPLLNTASPNGWTYTMTFSQTTAKFTWTVTGNGGVQPSFITSNNVVEQLGFVRTLTPTAQYFSGDTLTSTTVIDMSPENNIFIRSEICLGGDNNSDILQDLQGSGVPPFGQINYQCTELEGYSKGLNKSSDVFRFYITNEDDEGLGRRILQLNDKNWTATLLLYKRTTFFDKIRNGLMLMIRKFI